MTDLRLDNWRDMESAPMDGTLIWVATDEGKIHIAFWESKWNWKRLRVDRLFRSVWSRDCDEEDEKEKKFTATHWQPLPEPPA